MIFTITTKDSQHMLLFVITEDYELSKDISQEVFLALFKSERKTGLFQTWQIESTGDESDIQQMYGLL